MKSSGIFAPLTATATKVPHQTINLGSKWIAPPPTDIAKANDTRGLFLKAIMMALNSLSPPLGIASAMHTSTTEKK